MKTLRALLRCATLVDVPAITEIYNEAIRTATFDTETKTLADRQSWFAAHSGAIPFGSPNATGLSSATCV